MDLTGKTFGGIIALERAGSFLTKRGSRRLWLCRCLTCGKEFIKKTDHIVSRRDVPVSCGCLQTKHGCARHGKTLAVYKIWTQMKQRCLNPKSVDFYGYGARGITVCREWQESFAAFLTDVGPRPSIKFSLDRIDNEGHYEPGNVRWATAKEQASHRRHSPRTRYKRPAEAHA